MSLMSTHELYKTDGWKLISVASACSVQVRGGPANSSWAEYCGHVRIFVGDNQPTEEDVPYFELEQGEFFSKTTAAQNLYMRIGARHTEGPIYITLMEHY